MHETSAWTWCSGRTWRERVGREVGAGIRMGKTCEPKAFSFQCMTKFTTNKKKKTRKKKSWKKNVSMVLYRVLPDLQLQSVNLFYKFFFEEEVHLPRLGLPSVFVAASGTALEDPLPNFSPQACLLPTSPPVLTYNRLHTDFWYTVICILFNIFVLD